MLSHMHPQLAAFFQYRVEQQKLLEQLDGPGAVMPMPDLKGLRAWYKMFGQRVGGPVLEVAEVRDFVAETDERPLHMRLYRPRADSHACHAGAHGSTRTDMCTGSPADAHGNDHPGARTHSRPTETVPPCLVYFHGGGWSMGDLDTHDRVCRRLALAAHAVVISVDYGLSPELPWPQAAHDAIAATRWIQASAGSLAIDAHRVGVAGDSAGGNLAAIVALALRAAADDQPQSENPPPLVAQLLIYPATDLRSGFEPRHPSLTDNADRPPLSTAQMCEHMRHYLDDQPEHARHWQASPLLANDHRGAAPALIITAGLDPLRDDGIAYAQTLSRAGVDVLLRNYAGHTHGFVEMAGVLDTVPDAFALMGQWFRQQAA
jgi:acetyl esterase